MGVAPSSTTSSPKMTTSSSSPVSSCRPSGSSPPRTTCGPPTPSPSTTAVASSPAKAVPTLAPTVLFKQKEKKVQSQKCKIKIRKHKKKIIVCFIIDKTFHLKSLTTRFSMQASGEKKSCTHRKSFYFFCFSSMSSQHRHYQNQSFRFKWSLEHRVTEN